MRHSIRQECAIINHDFVEFVLSRGNVAITPAIVLMAAGMGSRYGSLKQIEPIGPSGETIMEYSIYDALKAGFGKVVFIIKKDIEKDFREAIGRRIENAVDTEYVFQKIDDLPPGFSVPTGRKKPWGTGHAVLSCRHSVKGPFSVINTDDYYGSASFKLMGDFLKTANANGDDSRDGSSGVADGDAVTYAMTGFRLGNTLSRYGQVSRAVCTIDGNGFLMDIKEYEKIGRIDGRISASASNADDQVDSAELTDDTVISMNMWGFQPSIFGMFQTAFADFLQMRKERLADAELYLPYAVRDIIRRKNARVKVLISNEQWYGVTYREDRETVIQAIRMMVGRGLYPRCLWHGVV